jgi:hypothetical protein
MSPATQVRVVNAYCSTSIKEREANRCLNSGTPKKNDAGSHLSEPA